MPVLYRKYRPKTFSEIVGQEHIVKTLTNAISMGMTSHAYLFYGSRGLGKTTTARLLAKAVNCERNIRVNPRSNPRGSASTNYEPCNQCWSCREINEGRAMDLIEIDAASNRGIDEIRSLKEGINIVPVKSEYKVYIIDECHQLTEAASNALLKTLEEPPSHVLFVLCTTEYQKVLPTIASRCQRFEFMKLTLPEIVDKLDSISKSEGVKSEKSALELIARSAEGSIRDAESLLDEVINLEDKEIKKNEVENILGIVGTAPVAKFIDFLIKKDKKGAIEYLENLTEKGTDIENFSKKLTSYLKDLLLIKISPLIFERSEVFTKEEKEFLKEQEKEFSEENLKGIVKIFLDAQSQIKWSDLPQLLLELAAMDSIEELRL